MNYTKWKIDRHDEIDSSNRIVLRISTEFEPSKENINQLKKRISKTDEMYEALKEVNTAISLTMMDAARNKIKSLLNELEQ